MNDWPPPEEVDEDAFERPLERSWDRPAAWTRREFWLGALVAALTIWLGDLIWGVLT